MLDFSHRSNHVVLSSALAAPFRPLLSPRPVFGFAPALAAPFFRLRFCSRCELSSGSLLLSPHSVFGFAPALAKPCFRISSAAAWMRLGVFFMVLMFVLSIGMEKAWRCGGCDCNFLVGVSFDALSRFEIWLKTSLFGYVVDTLTT